MATQTLVTANPLVAVRYSQAPGVLLPAELAAIANAIKDANTFGNPVPSAFNYMGILAIPGGPTSQGNGGIRGWVQVLPGEVVAYDGATGWPILVSAKAIAGGDWTLV
jgi:hypothetical protein